MTTTTSTDIRRCAHATLVELEALLRGSNRRREADVLRALAAQWQGEASVRASWLLYGVLYERIGSRASSARMRGLREATAAELVSAYRGIMTSCIPEWLKARHQREIDSLAEETQRCQQEEDALAAARVEGFE